MLPALLAALTYALAPMKLGTAVNILLAVALIVPMGPMLYRVAFAPLAHASVLVLLIAAFGVHFSLMGLGLVFFGPEGITTKPVAGADVHRRRHSDHRAERRGGGGDGAAADRCSRCSSSAR